MVVASGKARGGVLRPGVRQVSRVVAHLWTVCDSVVSGGMVRAVAVPGGAVWVL